jgi:NAD(P)-dependent dehydrogenase (short-subunit alcohol dehydrogenase family)
MVTRSPVDLADETQVMSWIDFAVSEYGDFDILYNNASAARFKPTELMTLEEWNLTLANELTLVFLAVKHATSLPSEGVGLHRQHRVDRRARVDWRTSRTARAQRHQGRRAHDDADVGQ